MKNGKYEICRLSFGLKNSEKVIIDITGPNVQREIIAVEHNRIYRAAQGNITQILANYFFAKLEKKAKDFVTNCRTRSQSK